MGYAGRYGRSVLPYGSNVVGRFEDYKDPGHLVGKGWMVLKFDRMVIEPNTVLPIYAKVVDVSGYNVDREGRILGKGHATRDTVAWTIPILWPINLINLPRSGPRPILKGETRLTLKVMDDLTIPRAEPSQQGLPDLTRRTPSAYTPHRADSNLPPNPVTPINYSMAFLSPPSLPPAQSASPCGTTPHSMAIKARMPYLGSNRQDAVTLIYNDGRPPEQIHNYMLTSTRLYVMDENRCAIPVSQLDLDATKRVNRDAGIDFRLPVTSTR
jgi:hypothetical protein